MASKLTDPELYIRTGTRYLADLLRLFGGETELAVAAYNAGAGAVQTLAQSNWKQIFSKV